MAFRAQTNLRSALQRVAGNNRSFASSTAPKLASSSAGSATPHNKYSITGEYAPVYIVWGFVAAAVAMAAHTAKQQIFHSTGVYFNKKKRESIPEADNPDRAIASANKFLNKSFLRKVGNIQEKKGSSRSSSN